MVASVLRLLHDARLAKWLHAIWFVMCCLAVQGTIFSRTVTKARCIANCYTIAGYNNESEKTCQTSACQECLSPCGKTFSTESQCLQTCINSSSCEASCRFLTQLKNFSSISSGDDSLPPTPGIPTVTNKTFTSISLRWDPVQNTSGTPVYLIAMDIKGDWDKIFYFREVFTEPRATLKTVLLCALVDSDMRVKFNGIFYKFHIAVLTENSSISYGAQTLEISLPQPAPVSNVTLTSLVYDSANNPKLKLTASWTKSEEANVVTNHVMFWDQQCPFLTSFNPKVETIGPQARGSMYIDERIKKCNHTLKVYALSQCIQSNATTITYEYPGCRNITNYPTELCYKFDPPDSPDEYRKVRNLRDSLVSIDDDYRFNMNVTWDPPLYAYKPVQSYSIRWKKRRGTFFDFKFGTSFESSYKIPQLLPEEIYDVTITPKFKDSTPGGIEETLPISTPHVDPADVTVRNLMLDDFTFSPQTGKFDLNVTWQKPSFNYSQIVSYALSYQVNEGNKNTRSTDKTYFNIPAISHGEPVAFNVTPQYMHSWISGIEARAKSTAPGPDPAQVTVRSLVLNAFTLTPQTGNFHLNVTWLKPLFNYSQISSYALSFQVGERTENISQTNKTYFIVYGISPGEQIEFSVTAQYINSRITGVKAQRKTNAPSPSDKEITVQHLRLAGEFIEDKESNTFAVNFTWEPPSFKYREVLYYNLTYELSGYSRDQFPCSSLVKSPRCTKTGLEETSFLLSGILPQERVSIEVTPVYNDRYITGKMKRAEESAPAPRGELLKVVGIMHDELVPSSNGSFLTNILWQKPLFNHSAVSHYSYTIININGKTGGNIHRRAIDFTTVFTTKYTNVTIDGIQLDKPIEFQVTPVFVVYMVTGRKATISILKTETPSTHVSTRSMSPGEIAGLVLGLLLLILIVLCLMIWCHRERQKKLEAKGLVYGKNALMIDHWEVDGDLVVLEEELGEGAFGKVYKGALKELTTSSQKQSFKSTMKTARNTTIKGNEMFTVAVKMLHNMTDSDQRRDFLEEIQLMKAVGSHKNIVNMLGCCTVQEPMFLLVEYIPYGDLLHYLRKHRGKVKGYLGDDSRGPYRSTYCETYFTDENPAGISVKATKRDRVYVNAPEMQKEENGNIQLVSFNSFKPEEKTGEENKGLDTEGNEVEQEINEEYLTPGDLMAFAWQISQGMEYLAKKGFIHRDLAARNVLVGEKKIAKVADFGLTRHVYEEKVYHAKRNRKLPLKWMSIEAIFDQTFTAQSDVWAFGVVLWELVTLGGTPYPTIDNRELLRLLKDGYRMEKPDTCNDELYNMMMDCWKEDPEGRPTFTKIRERLEEMMQMDNPYLDLSAVDETREYYNVPSFNSLMEESADDDLFDKDDQECRQDSNETAELANQKPTGDSNGNIADNLKQTEEKHNSKNTVTDNGYFTISGQGVKDVTIDFNDVDMRLYRPARRGIAF